MNRGRFKKPHRKVKTGCITCRYVVRDILSSTSSSSSVFLGLTLSPRKRRIKCDEAKPSCRQCSASLRKCEGYNSPQAWIFTPRQAGRKIPTDESRNDSSVGLNIVTHVISPLRVLGDDADKRSFQHWVEQGAPLYSCYFGMSHRLMIPSVLSQHHSRPLLLDRNLAQA